MEIRANIKVLTDYEFHLALEAVLYAKFISGIRFAIKVIQDKLWAVAVVKTTSTASSICPINKSGKRSLSIGFHAERAF